MANIKKKVRERYGAIAKSKSSGCGCGPAPSSCCGSPTNVAEHISKGIGYSEKEMQSVPEGANLGLGCGNPTALAALKKGETVLDLGSGAGFDAFLAAKKVGPSGKVIGVDMTPEMIDKARENAKKGKCANVEFRLGEIEHLPVADNYVDVIVSNCVINLAPDKQKVFAEAYRVLKPGGRVSVSDIVLTAPLPDFIRKSAEAYTACIAGAIMKDEYIKTIKQAGFKTVKIIEESHFPIEFMANDPTAKMFIAKSSLPKKQLEAAAHSVVSIKVQATKA